MPEKEWLTTDEVAQSLGITKDRLYNVISILRRVGLVHTTPDPNNYRQTLILAADMPEIRKFLRKDDGGTQTA